MVKSIMFKATFSDEKDNKFSAKFVENGPIRADFSNTVIAEKVITDMYSGDYTITPSATGMVLETVGKASSQNFVINPIPKNYGLITWNGSYLTVS